MQLKTPSAEGVLSCNIFNHRNGYTVVISRVIYHHLLLSQGYCFFCNNHLTGQFSFLFNRFHSNSENECH